MTAKELEATVAERVAGVIGGDAVAAGAAAEAWSVCGAVPSAVARPRDAAQVAALLELAAAEGWRVEPAGAGGCLGWGRPPERVDLVIAVDRLDAVVEDSPGDLTIGVGAGMPLGRLAARLAERGQWLPLDPPGAARATLGAVLAHAATGPLRCGYGTPRDHVLGIQFATGDGRLLEVGGRVVKNVAGYDLAKLLVGSRGTLGILTRVHLRLRALPAVDATLVVAGEAEPLAAVAAALADAGVAPAALELVRSGAAGLEAATGRWTLLVRLHGGPAAVDDAEARVRSAAGDAPVVRLATGGADELWRRLAEREAAAPVVIRLSDRPSELAATMKTADLLGRVLDRDGAGHGAAAHAGDGIVRLHVPAPATAAEFDAMRDALVSARDRLAGGGSLIVARAPASLAAAIDPFGPVGSPLRLMHGLRSVFDPAGVLSAGRFA